MVPRKIFLQTVVYGDDHTVFCADFSDNMLASVRDVIETEKIQSITLHKLCWQEDWDKHDLPVCDMAFASFQGPARPSGPSGKIGLKNGQNPMLTVEIPGDILVIK